MPIWSDYDLSALNEDDAYVSVAGYNTVSYNDDYGPVIISNRAINLFNNQISVSGDIKSQYIQFQIDRYIDGIDLTKKKLYIHYERPEDGAGDNNQAVNVQASDNYIRFGWLIPQAAVYYDGILKVMPYASELSGSNLVYVMKTLYAEYNVHVGLALSGGISDPGSDWYNNFVLEMSNKVSQIEKYAKNAANSATDAANSATDAVNSVEKAQSIVDNFDVGLSVVNGYLCITYHDDEFIFPWESSVDANVATDEEFNSVVSLNLSKIA